MSIAFGQNGFFVKILKSESLERPGPSDDFATVSGTDGRHGDKIAFERKSEKYMEKTKKKEKTRIAAYIKSYLSYPYW